ncbi:amino acid permease [Actinomadura atramentaria]|uniref:amino acid permease n=1 Tax=Actinomadura atramentaria TaxID=1990 RepID=UPI00036B46E9|nr:amino acid permease [Actinomadura atramentaria]
MGEPGTPPRGSGGAVPPRPPADDAVPAAADPAGGRLGLPQATALLVGNVVGAGIFLLPASLAAIGTISLGVLVVATAGALALALVFGRLGARIPAAGGPYAYTRDAFGEFAGFWSAWSFWLTAWGGNAGVAVAWIGYVEYFTGHHGAFCSIAIGLAGIWTPALANLAGARTVGRVQLATAAVTFAPLLLVVLAGPFSLSPAGLGPFTAGGGSAWDAAWLAAGLILFLFSGMESATILGGRLADPARDIGRASVLGVALCGGLYLLATAAVFGTVPHDRLVHSGAPFADAIEAMFGGGAGGAVFGPLVAGCAALSAIGGMNGWTMLVGEMPLAAARDGLFPAAFGRVTRRGVPVAGILTGSVLTSLLLLFAYASKNAFNTILLFASFTAAVPYFFSASAQLFWYVAGGRGAGGRRVRGRRVAVDLVPAVAALLFAFAMVYGSGERAVLLGVLALLAGVPVYIWTKARRGEYGPADHGPADHGPADHGPTERPELPVSPAS